MTKFKATKTKCLNGVFLFYENNLTMCVWHLIYKELEKAF